MRYIYTFVLYLLTPYLLIRLWWKGRRLPAYRKRIAERFFIGSQLNPVDVWVHAVSLGEVIAAIPLIESMLEKKWSILITTMTPTGSERVTTRFGNKVAHCYIPYDLPIILKRFFRQIRPKVGVIMETELWPNLINQAHKAKIPLFLANARLSQSSSIGYMKLKRLFNPVLNQFTAILAQNKNDAARYIALGAQNDLVKIYGNMKFDVKTNEIDSKPYLELKNCWGASRPVIIAASTHEGEESQILQNLNKLQQAIPNIILLIAPRHPERFKSVYQLCLESGLNTGLRSNVESLSPKNDVIVLDSLGELLAWYQMSDYAFVGGSFIPIGGHNVLEPIAMKVPVFSGHLVHNFKAICDDLQEKEAIHIVHNIDELIESIIKLSNDKELRDRIVINATGVLESNKGSVERHLNLIEQVMLTAQ